MNDPLYPLITVVIPCYNRASLVIKAIGSVLAQSYPHFEIIVADDGSTDMTCENVIALKDPRIRLLRLAHSGHPGIARNQGAAAGKGAWIAFLDSDDIWHPRKLEWQLQKLAETKGCWCYGLIELMDEAGFAVQPRTNRQAAVSGWIVDKLLTTELAVVICTLIIERKLFEELGGFNESPRLAFREDYEFALRLARREPASAVAEVVARILEHSGRATRSIRDSNELSALSYTIFLETEKEERYRKLASKRKAFLLSEAAVHRSAAGEKRKAWKQLMNTIGKDNWRHWLSAAWRTCKFSILGNNLRSKSTG